MPDSRYAQALDILFGRRRIYFQQPHKFFYPELPQIQFYDRRRFAWAKAVEAAMPAIREEFEGVLGDDRLFAPYLESRTTEPQIADNALIGNRDWSACYLVRDGTPVEETVARCPRTVAALQDVPLDHIPGTTPSILFSLLRPKAHIPPHSGLLNTRLICHLPLIVPEGCWFRVGNETRRWREGELIVFDDSIEHEAMNPTERLRVVLLFEIWRPELGEEERRFVAAMFGAIECYGKAG